MQYWRLGSVRKDTIIWAGVGSLLVAIVAVIIFFVMNYARETTVVLGDGVFSTRVAVTSVDHARGLSGTEELKPHQAMLFVFESDEIHDIWMKDMKFAIDVVWLDKEKRVIHTESSLSPASYPKSYGPKKPTRYIVELPAGTVEGKNITKGKQASFNEKGVF